METRLQLVGFILCTIISFSFSDDSLMGVLNAVNRKQTDLSDYQRALKNFDFDNAPPKSRRYSNDNGKYTNNLGKLKSALFDYFEERNLLDEIPSSPSPFRERIEQVTAPQTSLDNERLAHKIRAPQEFDEYSEFQRERSEDNPYRRSHPTLALKRFKLQKRNRAFQQNDYDESNYSLNNVRRNKLFNGMKENEGNFNENCSWYKLPPELRKHMKSTFSYGDSPHTSVAKRNYLRHLEKKRTIKSKTDPQVVTELTQIFKLTPNNKNEIQQTKEIARMENQVYKKAEESNKQTSIISHEKPLNIKKKSIDWSDYFGIDRRKKSAGDVDEWLVDTINKTVKKSKAEGNMERDKLDKTDEKLRNLEESIIDDALKYTGAHEGTKGKELKNVRDQIIDRLIMAYNLEKMRNAFSDYKQSRLNSMVKSNLKARNHKKRASVARKQAKNDDMANYIGDNNIRCTNSDNENCGDDNYPSRYSIMEKIMSVKGKCANIEKTCKEVSTSSSRGNVFEEACNVHQACLLCVDNNWFGSTRECNMLYLSKADEICNGNQECRLDARRSVKYLLQVNRALIAELDSACHLECPDTY